MWTSTKQIIMNISDYVDNIKFADVYSCGKSWYHVCVNREGDVLKVTNPSNNLYFRFPFDDGGLIGKYSVRKNNAITYNQGNIKCIFYD